MPTLPLTGVIQFLANVIAIPGYVGAISDTSNSIASNLGALNLVLPSIGSITSNNGIVTVGVSALTADQGVLDKVTGGFNIVDTVSNVTQNLAAITGDHNIVSVTGTGGQVNVSVAAFQANQGGLDKITGGFLVVDTAQHITQNLDSLNDPLTLAITVSDSLPVGANVAQLSSDAVAIGKLHNADFSNIQLAVADSGANIVGGLATLQGLVAKIGSITPTSGTVVAPITAFMSDQPVLDKVVGGFSIADTATAITAALPALNADTLVNTITSTTTPVAVSVDMFTANRTGLDKIVGGFTVTDATSNLFNAVVAMAADPNIASVVPTDGIYNITVAQLAQYHDLAQKAVGGYKVVDTVANVQAALATLAQDSHIQALTTTDGLLSQSVADFAANRPLLDKSTGGFAILDTAGAVTAALSTLAGDPKVAAITATGRLVGVTTGTFAALQPTLDKITGGFRVTDTAGAIRSTLATLANDSHVFAIDTTDGPLSTTVAQFNGYRPTLDKITGGFAIADTAAAVQSGLAGLSADSAITSIVAGNGPVLASVAALASDRPTLDKIVGGFAIADTAASIRNALASLQADAAHITSIAASGGPVLASLNDLATVHPTLDKIVGGFAVSDTAAAVQGALATIAADPAVTSIVATGGQVVASAQTFATLQSTLDKIVGGFAVSDTAAAIQGALASLSADRNVTAITATGELVKTTVAGFLANQATLDKIAGGFAIVDTAAAVQGALTQLSTDSHIASISAVPGMVTTSVQGFLANEPTLDKIVGGFAVSDTAAAIHDALRPLLADPKVLVVTATDGVVPVSPDEYSNLQSMLGKISSGVAIGGLSSTNPVDLPAVAYKGAYQAIYTVDRNLLQIVDTSNGNAVVATFNLAQSLSGSIVTLGGDGASGTLISLMPYAAAALTAGDVVISNITGAPYGSLINHYANGQFTGTTYDYTTATGQPFTGYVSVSDGIESFQVDGSLGRQDIVGARDINFIGTQNPAGSGEVVVNLKDGTVTRGSQLDATLHNIIGVQLGPDSSSVFGLASGTDLLYGGSGTDTFYGMGGTDYIQGGSGVSNIIGGSGNEIFYSGNGINTMKGGTLANDMVGGTTAASRDTFYSSGGADYMTARGGTAAMVGGSGFDALFGGSGTNVLLGGSGLAVFNGGTGSNAGTDIVYGGSGTTLMYQGSGVSAFKGATGNDAIYGGSGKSFVYGGSGTDVITTGAGNQYIQAGTGKTVINETAANLTAGRYDLLDNFKAPSGATGTSIYLPTAAAAGTKFLSTNNGVAIVMPTTTGTGSAVLFVSNATIAGVHSAVHFTL